MYCLWLAVNTGRKKSTKIRHLRMIAQFCRALSSQLRYQQSEKFLNSNMCSTCPHNMANYDPLTTNQTLRRMFGRLLYILWGSYPLTEFCPVQNSLYIQVLRSPILTALLNGTPAAGVSQTLRCGKNVLFLTAMLPCCDGEIKLYIKGMELLNFDKERHLYSARLLSLWASAHILIIFCRAHYNKLVARISLLVARSDVYYAICCNWNVHTLTKYPYANHNPKSNPIWPIKLLTLTDPWTKVVENDFLQKLK